MCLKIGDKFYNKRFFFSIGCNLTDLKHLFQQKYIKILNYNIILETRIVCSEATNLLCYKKHNIR